MLVLAVPTVTDTSNQFAESQRQVAAGVGVEVDTSHDAEFQRMQAFEDTPWEEAEARRFATLDPAGN